MSKLKLFAEKLINLSIKEINELSEILKNDYGIKPVLFFNNNNNSNQNNNNQEKKEEKTHFDLILKNIGESKLSVIKLVKEITGLGLKESKDLVESVPKLIKKKISKKDITLIKNKFEDLGAEIELK